MPGSSSIKKKAPGQLRASSSSSARTSSKGLTSVGSVTAPHKRKATSGSGTLKVCQNREGAASIKSSSTKLVKLSTIQKKSPSSRGLRGSHARNNPGLPPLLEGWEWSYYRGFYSAFIFTFEYDCIVAIREGTLYLSTGVAPIEIVQAVLQANSLSLPMRKVTHG